jgi:hypothetical protein
MNIPLSFFLSLTLTFSGVFQKWGPSVMKVRRATAARSEPEGGPGCYRRSWCEGGLFPDCDGCRLVRWRPGKCSPSDADRCQEFMASDLVLTYISKR